MNVNMHICSGRGPKVRSLRVQAIYARPHFTARDNFMQLQYAERVLFSINFFVLINVEILLLVNRHSFHSGPKVETYIFDSIF
jgi:hypothetical protein